MHLSALSSRGVARTRGLSGGARAGVRVLRSCRENQSPSDHRSTVFDKDLHVGVQLPAFCVPVLEADELEIFKRVTGTI